MTRYKRIAGVASAIVVTVMVLFVLAAVSRLSADELVVSGFRSDSLGRYDASTGDFISNYAAGSALDGPLASRLGSDGLLYVASEASNQVKRFNVTTGAFVDNFVTSGLGGLNGPSGITWDQSGDLLVSSFNSSSVLKYHGTTGAFIETAVASGLGGLAGPDNGTIMGADGLLYVPSYSTNQILRFDLDNDTSEVFINGILRPRVIVFKDDNLFITSELSDAVQRFDEDGAFIENFIQPGSAILDEPVGLEFFAEHWYVSSASMDKVLQFDVSGNLINADFIISGSGGLDAPVFIVGIKTVPEPGSTTILSLMIAGFFISRRKRG